MSSRSEDLRRYQSVILSSLGMNSKVDPAKVDGEVKQKVKFYGQQASDTMLRPEQVIIFKLKRNRLRDAVA